MEELSHIKYITIGGQKCTASVKYKDIFRFIQGLRKEVLRYKDKPIKEIIIRNEYFFDVVWRCLHKTGWLFWRKPFRTKHHMEKSIYLEELDGITMFVSKFVLPSMNTEVDNKKKEETVEG